MTVPQEHEMEVAGELNGFWSANVDISRTPSPGVPTKRMRMTLGEIRDDFINDIPFKEDDFNNLLRVQQTPEALGYDNTTSWRTLWFSPPGSSQQPPNGKRKMQTGCIPCLYVITPVFTIIQILTKMQSERRTLRSQQSRMQTRDV
jgi:hypothetical protein